MKYEGHVHEIDLIAKLVELGDQSFTGAIRFENDGVIKILYLKGGNILSASSNDRTDSIDEILLKSGKVTRDHVRQALTRRKENETLGDALLSLGFITKKELVWARRIQVVVIVRSILQWNDGSFTIVSDYLPKREEGTVFDLRQIVLEIIVTDDDREKFDALLRSGDAIFRKNIHFDDAYKALALNEEADQVVRLIDGRHTAAEVATSSSVEPFSVFKLLHALHILGLVTETNVKHELSSPAPQLDFDFELDEEPAPEQPQLLPGVLPEPPSIPVAEEEEFLSMPEPPMSFDETEALAIASEPAWNEPIAEEPEPVMHASIEPDAPVGVVDESQEITDEQAAIVEPPRNRRPLAAAALVVLLAGAGAYGAFSYWKRSQSAAEKSVPARAKADLAPSPIVSSPELSPAGTETVATETIAPTETVAAAVIPPAKIAQPDPARPKPVKIASDTGFRVQKTGSGYEVSNLETTRSSQPSSSPAPANDPLRKRYDAMAREYAASNRGVAFTIQFEIVCQTDSVTKAVSSGGSNVWFVPIDYRGRDCYRVFWGQYDSRVAAERAIDEIPSSLQSGKPVVVSPAEVIAP